LGYQTKVQQIKRVNCEQWYISLPAQLAQALEFKQSETVEWFVEDKETLALKRHNAPGLILKKKHKI
jgi:antitoxin component of MazEF toxin-antitoxin module